MDCKEPEVQIYILDLITCISVLAVSVVSITAKNTGTGQSRVITETVSVFGKSCRDGDGTNHFMFCPVT